MFRIAALLGRWSFVELWFSSNVVLLLQAVEAQDASGAGAAGEGLAVVAGHEDDGRPAAAGEVVGGGG